MAKKSYAWFEKRYRTKALDLAQEQITKALDTVKLLHNVVKSASEGNKKEAREHVEKLMKEEEEVDNLRRSVFKELKNVAVSFEFREDMLHLVKRLDVMADLVKDSARSVMVLLEAKVLRELWKKFLEISKDLVACATTLRKAIETLGTESAEANELAKKIDEIEQKVDEKCLETKSLLIKYTDKMDCVTLMLLKDLLESMENVADTCDDTADYVRILTVVR